LRQIFLHKTKRAIVFWMMALLESLDRIAMAASSETSYGCKHQAKKGRAKGEQTQSQSADNAVRVGRRRWHS
jgi:hypothetical protein